MTSPPGAGDASQGRTGILRPLSPVLVLVLLLAVVTPGVAAARPPPGARAVVAIDIDGCATFDGRSVERVRDILRAELADAGVVVQVASDRGAPATTSVHLAFVCDAAAVMARAEVVDTATRKHVRRDIAMADVPRRLWARTLAIAMGALLRATWAELAIVDPVPSEPGATRQLRAAIVSRIAARAHRATADEAGARGTDSLWALRLGLGARYVERFSTGVAAVMVGLALAPRGAPLVATLDLGADVSVIEVPLGTLTLVHPFADASVSLRGSLAPVTFAAGAFVRGGVLLVTADAASPAVAHAGAIPALVTGARLGARWQLTRRTSVALEVDAGAAILAARIEAGGHPASGIDGLIASAAIVFSRGF